MQIIEQKAYNASLRLFSHFGTKADKYRTGIFEGGAGSALFAMEDTDVEEARIRVIEGVLSDKALIFALHLSAAAFFYPQVKRAIKELAGGGPTLMLALEVCGELEQWSFPALREGYEVLCRYLAVADSRQNIALMNQLFQPAEGVVTIYAGRGRETLPLAAESKAQEAFGAADHEERDRNQIRKRD